MLGEAHRARLLEFGLPRGAVVRELPNFVPNGRWAPSSRAGEGEYAMVAGRLVREKGFDTAIAAARRARVPLSIAGAGPDEARLRSLSAGADVRFAGWLSEEALAAARARAAAVLVPSRWEEVCPYSVLDALACGVPALVSELGGLPELAGRGYALPAGDVDAWASALAALWADPAIRGRAGEAALARARERFGEQRYLAGLLAAYRG